MQLVFSPFILKLFKFFNHSFQKGHLKPPRKHYCMFQCLFSGFSEALHTGNQEIKTVVITDALKTNQATHVSHTTSVITAT